MDDLQHFAVAISFSIDTSLYLQLQDEEGHLCLYQLVHQSSSSKLPITAMTGLTS